MLKGITLFNYTPEQLAVFEALEPALKERTGSNLKVKVLRGFKLQMVPLEEISVLEWSCLQEAIKPFY